MPILRISAENAEFQIIRALKLNRTKRSKEKEVFIEGTESIKQADAAGVKFTRIIAADLGSLSAWARSLVDRNGKAKIIEMSSDLYRALCDRDEPSEIVATAKVETLDLTDLDLPENPFILIFDRPSDCGNFGSIIRSANSFNVDAIFLIGHSIDFFDPKVIRASLGSVFHSKIVAVPSMHDFSSWIALQKERTGIALVGTDSAGDISLSEKPLTRPIAIILGNEAKGMSVALKESCDYIVRIPISGAVNSLNVACAGTVFLWDVYRNSRAPNS